MYNYKRWSVAWYNLCRNMGWSVAPLNQLYVYRNGNIITMFKL